MRILDRKNIHLSNISSVFTRNVIKCFAGDISGGSLENPSIKITNIQPHHHGVYSCAARNAVDETSVHILLQVCCKAFNKSCFSYLLIYEQFPCY